MHGFDVEKELKRIEREERREEERQKREKFKQRLEREHGLEGHPKADTLFSLAWDYGHAYGFDEVECHYHDLAVLVEESE